MPYHTRTRLIVDNLRREVVWCPLEDCRSYVGGTIWFPPMDAKIRWLNMSITTSSRLIYHVLHEPQTYLSYVYQHSELGHLVEIAATHHAYLPRNSLANQTNCCLNHLWLVLHSQANTINNNREIGHLIPFISLLNAIKHHIKSRTTILPYSYPH